VLRNLKLAGTLAVTAMLALLVPAYSQQETDPTWYDPSAAPNRAVIHNQKKQQLANRKNQPKNKTKVSSASPDRSKTKKEHVQAARNGQQAKEFARNDR
jgi:predicted lipid-binding transport protein (Tim44 family)